VNSPFRFDPDIDSYCVLGNPVAHSKSPRIHQAFARQFDQNISYQAIQVDIDGFVQALEGFRQAGGKGLNITVPFKREAWKAAETLTDRAAAAGSVNTMWFADDGSCHADTTDGAGLVSDLNNHNIPLQGKKLLILGAGGAVRGVLKVLYDADPGQIVIVNRTASRARELEQHFAEFDRLRAADLEQLGGEKFDVVINGTSASLQGELIPLPDSILAEGAGCYDMVYADEDTVFTRWAREHGAATCLDGLGMLVEQAAESFFIWRGVRPDTRPVIDMLR